LKSFDTKTGVIADIWQDSYGKDIPVSHIMTISKGSDGNLWIGGSDGGCCLKEENGKLSLAELPFDLKGELIQYIFEASTKVTWIATRNGLISIDRNDGSTARYTRKEGLPSNIVHGIEEDESGRLWISTENGISCFNPFSGKFRNFTSNEGITNIPLNAKSHCRRQNGDMLFGGIYGITEFSPEQIEDNPFTPIPLIEKIQILNEQIRPNDRTGILDKNIMLAESVRLNHRQNSFTLEFSVANYLSGRHNTFAYILEGSDKEWTETEQRSVSYSNLRHGRYRFMLKAANNDGKWNETPTVLEIVVTPAWYKTTVAYVFWFLLGLLAFVVSYRFIIDRKERENRNELEKQEKAHQEDIHQMKMRFFINISHEMRTPLTLIINPLQEMISKSNDTWMQKQLKYVERNAKRLLHLVNQLMDYRRAELGVFKLRIRPENIHKIIKENWAYYEKFALKKKIRYSLISDLEGKLLHIDGQYLELILNNLLSNAFKYTESGEIRITATEQDSKLSISVSDTGIGIPQEEQEKIFERFYQSDNQHSGSGIGLSLVQRLVELHHGQIKLNSEPGKGSTFTILLPVSLNAYSEEEIGNPEQSEIHISDSPEMYLVDSEKQEDESCEPSEKKRSRLLIAEDNDEVRTYMKNGLSKMFDILLAKNGEEALQMLKEQEPDLVVTDMMMPVMDGKKLCMHIKQNISTSHIPVIMLSAKTDSKDELDALKAGADDFMTKPFSMPVLVAKIQNMLRTLHHIHDKATNSMDIAPEKMSLNTMDEEFLVKAIEVLEAHIDDTSFSTTEFAKAMNMSRSNLHLKLKALTGESALDFIRKIRFKEACRLLKDGRYSISEISDKVGFNTPSYFATCFKKYMGCLPTEYIKKNQRE
jgi:signal transduction histidine kinase/DNA-binding response OmpR family regulator